MSERKKKIAQTEFQLRMVGLILEEVRKVISEWVEYTPTGYVEELITDAADRVENALAYQNTMRLIDAAQEDGDDE